VPALDVDVIVPSGRTRTVVLRLDPGTYDYVCSVGDHEEQGMKGRVQVVGADGTLPAGLPAQDAARHHGDHTAHGASRG
jgi:hypothetical protein